MSPQWKVALHTVDILRDAVQRQDGYGALIAVGATLHAISAHVQLSRSPGPDTAPAAGDRLLTVDEAAAILGTSVDWLYRNRHTLPFARTLGRQVRFSEHDLRKWLADGRRVE